MFLAPLPIALTTLSTVNLDIDVLLSSMTEIKQTAGSVVPVERPAETALPAEPAHVERVTKKKAKDPKKRRIQKRIQKRWIIGACLAGGVHLRTSLWAKATAPTALGSQGIITSTFQRS